jgi:hypothetical protein
VSCNYNIIKAFSSEKLNRKWLLEIFFYVLKTSLDFSVSFILDVVDKNKNKFNSRLDGLARNPSFNVLSASPSVIKVSFLYLFDIL